jgi:hypothetical protein
MEGYVAAGEAKWVMTPLVSWIRNTQNDKIAGHLNNKGGLNE